MTFTLARLSAISLIAFAVPQTGFADPTFDFYGHINFGLFSVDDGTDSETYITDNDNSNTRIGARYSNDLDWGATILFNFETGLGISGSSTATMDDNSPDIDFERQELRKLEIGYETPSWGTFFLGQGSMSADGVVEADLSGTTVAAYIGISDLAGNYDFRPSGGDPTVRVGSVFRSFDGARRLRVRYDTPSVNGLTGSVSYGEEELDQDDDREFTDIGLKYVNDYGDVTVDGRLAYQWIDNDGGANEEILAGSVAVLHKPTGVSFALAAADPKENDANYVFAKLGYQQDWFAMGNTALSLDVFDGSDFNTDGSDSTSYGIAAVQRIDAYNLEVYASYRLYEYDQTGPDLEDIDLWLLGVRWKF